MRAKTNDPSSVRAARAVNRWARTSARATSIGLVSSFASGQGSMVLASQPEGIFMYPCRFPATEAESANEY